MSGAAFDSNGNIVIALAGVVRKMNATTGIVIWSYAIEDGPDQPEFKAAPVIDNEDNIYIGTKMNELSRFYALKADGSEILWRSDYIQADIYPSAAIGNDGNIYVASEGLPGGFGTNLHALDIETGAIVWTIDIGSINASSPVIGPEGLYIGSLGAPGEALKSGFYLVDIEADGYQVNAPWPCYRGAHTNSGRQ